MDWQKFGMDSLVGRKKVYVRSLRILDEGGSWRRFRICSVWDFSAEKFSKHPAQAQLIKDAQKRIGVLITGKHSGSVKIGRRLGVQAQVLTAFNTISKKAKRSLLADIHVEFIEEDGMLLGKEIGED